MEQQHATRRVFIVFLFVNYDMFSSYPHIQKTTWELMIKFMTRLQFSMTHRRRMHLILLHLAGYPLCTRPHGQPSPHLYGDTWYAIRDRVFDKWFPHTLAPNVTLTLARRTAAACQKSCPADVRMWIRRVARPVWSWTVWSKWLMLIIGRLCR